MTKTAHLTTQLRDVAWAFCFEVWGEALNAAGVNVDSELREADKVYYPQALCIALSSTPIPPNPSSTSSVPKPTMTSTSVSSSEKEKEQQKKKKKEKAKDVTK